MPLQNDFQKINKLIYKTIYLLNINLIIKTRLLYTLKSPISQMMSQYLWKLVCGLSGAWSERRRGRGGWRTGQGRGRSGGGVFRLREEW
jgi:hypothetical protein